MNIMCRCELHADLALRFAQALYSGCQLAKFLAWPTQTVHIPSLFNAKLVTEVELLPARQAPVPAGGHLSQIPSQTKEVVLLEGRSATLTGHSHQKRCHFMQGGLKQKSPRLY